MRDLELADMEAANLEEMGIELNPNMSELEKMSIVAAVATDIYEMEKEKEKEKEEKKSQIASTSSMNPVVPVQESQSLDNSKEEKKSIKLKLALKKPSATGALDISKDEREEEREMYYKNKNPVIIDRPTDHMSKEKRLKREKLLKRVRFECDDDSEEEAKEKKNIKKKKKVVINKSSNTNAENLTPPELPIQFKNRIQEEGGSDWKLVIEKSLYKTDLSKAHNRLSMPMTQINDPEFLTDEENRIIIEESKNMMVDVIGPNLDKFKLCFKKWDMKKESGRKTSTSFVFISGWNSLVRTCKLEVGMKLQVWSFRVNGQLHFAIAKIDETQGQEADPSTRSGNSSRGHDEGSMQSASPTSPASSHSESQFQHD